MRLLYCYMLFLDDKGQKKPYRGLDIIELNMSATDRFSYDADKNILIREDRKAPLPAGFWMNSGIKVEDGTETESRAKPEGSTEAERANLYNIHVIAGQNGSGKTTAIRRVMGFLDSLYTAANQPDRKQPAEIDDCRALLLLEENGVQYLLDYAPAVKEDREAEQPSQDEVPPDRKENKDNQPKTDGKLPKWIKNEAIKKDGFPNGQPLVFQCRGIKAFTEQEDAVRDKIAALLRKTKVIYLTNTLSQYDFECHLSDESRRAAFIYDASIGSSLSPDAAQFFPYEVYKQVKYVFSREHSETRLKLDDPILEQLMPRALRLHLRLEQYRDAFSRSLFPLIRKEFEPGQENDRISPSSLDLPTLLGMLCASAFADNLVIQAKKRGKQAYDDYLSIMKNGRNRQTDEILSSQQEAENMIRETANAFYDLFSEDIPPLVEHTDSITCVADLKNGRIVTGSEDHTLRVWDAATGKCLKTLVGHGKSVSCVAKLLDGRVVSGSGDHTLRVWDVETGQCLKKKPGHKGKINCVAVLQDGRVVSGSDDGILKVWDAAMDQCLKTHEVQDTWINCVAEIRDGRVVIGSGDGTLRVYDTATGECLEPFYEPEKGIQEGIPCVAVFLDGRRVVSGSTDHTLRVWDAATGKCLQTFKGHKGGVNCVAVLPDERVVSGSYDKTLRVWDAATGKCLQTFEEHEDSINCVIMLPDGRVVSGSGSKDHSLRIWRTKEQLKKSEPFAHELGEKCLDYIGFLYQHEDSLFSHSRFIRTSANTFELSLEAMQETNGNGTKDRETDNQKEKNLYQQLTVFIQKYRNTCKPAYTLDFDWGLSSGEENMLRIFSSLYHVFDQESNIGQYDEKKIYNNAGPEGKAGEEENSIGKTPCDTVLLFMDEADLTLHPEWQRRLIAILTAFIPQIYPTSCVKDIQLILSTHSPLILGDIPSESVTYLFARKDREENDRKNGTQGENGQKNGEQDGENNISFVPEETFGQNIHNILKHNFFLSEGTVGAFAAWKINKAACRLAEISAWISKKESADSSAADESEKNQNITCAPPNVGELDEIRQIINLVAPGVLRTRLEMLYEETDSAMKALEKENTKRGEEAKQFMNEDQILESLMKLTDDGRRRVLEAVRRKEGK